METFTRKLKPVGVPGPILRAIKRQIIITEILCREDEFYGFNFRPVPRTRDTLVNKLRQDLLMQML